MRGGTVGLSVIKNSHQGVTTLFYILHILVHFETRREGNQKRG